MKLQIQNSGLQIIYTNLLEHLGYKIDGSKQVQTKTFCIKS